MRQEPFHIALFAYRELHLDVLLPLFHYLKAHYQQVSLVGYPFKAGKHNVPEEGLSQQRVDSLRQQNIEVIPYQEHYSFDCTITADVVFDFIQQWGKTLCVGHGTISKNIYFTPKNPAWRESFHDCLCVPGHYYQNCFADKVHTHIVPTGFPKFANWPSQFGNSNHIQTILFAPTHNLDISAAPILADTLAQLSNKRILIRLHGASPASWKTHYQTLCSQYDHLEWCPNEGLPELFSQSDAILSDFSSIYVEYLLTLKPIFLFSSPELAQSPSYDPQSIEALTRSAAHTFSTALELKSTIENTFQQDLLPQRLKWKSKLFALNHSQILSNITQEIQTLCETERTPKHSPLHIIISKQWTSIQIENLKKKKAFSKTQIHVLEEIQSPWPVPCLFISDPVSLPWNFDQLYDISRFYVDASFPWASLGNYGENRSLATHFPTLTKHQFKQRLIQYRFFFEKLQQSGQTPSQGMFFHKKLSSQDEQQIQSSSYNGNYFIWAGQVLESFAN